MPNMLCICPTHKRVGMCADMIKSFKKTLLNKEHFQAHLILGLSKDDPQLEAYLSMAKKEEIWVYVSDSNSVTKVINEIYDNAHTFDYYHLLNDDVEYKTDNWHIILMQMLIIKGGGISFANDLLQSGNLCCFPVISANVAKAIGWLQYPRLNCLCGDNVWMEIGLKGKCVHYNDMVIIEHKTWINNKRGHDKPEYQAMLTPDWLHYNYFVKNDLEGVLLKVKEALNGIPK